MQRITHTHSCVLACLLTFSPTPAVAVGRLVLVPGKLMWEHMFHMLPGCRVVSVSTFLNATGHRWCLDQVCKSGCV
eukprot:1159313-Pelagomonas_calceolata.AAC.2